MKREFVPYELAVKLKEVGFNEDCLGYYYDKNFVTILHRLDKKVVKAPTLSQAFRWFREKYNLKSWVQEHNQNNYIYEIRPHKLTDYRENEAYVYEAHEEAELACLIKLIEIFEIEKENTIMVDLERINKRVSYIVRNLKKKRVNFDNIQFNGNGQKYFITGVKADKGHEELKVYYKWEKESTEYEADFFDFHNEYFENLLVLIESQLFILAY